MAANHFWLGIFPSGTCFLFLKKLISPCDKTTSQHLQFMNRPLMLSVDHSTDTFVTCATRCSIPTYIMQSGFECRNHRWIVARSGSSDLNLEIDADRVDFRVVDVVPLRHPTVGQFMIYAIDRA